LSIALKSPFSLLNYINVLKPRETGLLVFIGACSAAIAASFSKDSFPIQDFVLILLALIFGSAGANGLTNYLDREVDARMKRTCNRVLPSGKIEPAYKVLPMIIILIISGLILAWILSPVCFFIGLIGLLASGIWRKTISCTFLGIIAGSSPVLIGWYAIVKQPVIDIMPILFFCLIAIWTPIHVWTLMIANRSDYESAGLHYFPLSLRDTKVIVILAILSVTLCVVSLLFYFLTGKFHWPYLVVVSIISLIMIYANIRLLFAPSSRNAWLVYKLSAFPYLGIIFTTMVLDSWLM